MRMRANLAGFSNLHPYQPVESVGFFRVNGQNSRIFSRNCRDGCFYLQPAAGAHGELTGLLLIMAYHAAQGEKERNKVLIPDSAMVPIRRQL